MLSVAHGCQGGWKHSTVQALTGSLFIPLWADGSETSLKAARWEVGRSWSWSSRSWFVLAIVIGSSLNAACAVFTLLMLALTASRTWLPWLISLLWFLSPAEWSFPSYVDSPAHSGKVLFSFQAIIFITKIYFRMSFMLLYIKCFTFLYVASKF